jgi:hypothetical protein
MSYKKFTVPVGTIMAWSGGYFLNGTNGTFTNVLGNSVANANSYLNPRGFYICDGSAVNNSNSPIFNGAGRFLPNLTDSRFLQGNTIAGGVGLNTSNTVTISSNNLPSHSHTFTTDPFSGTSNSVTVASNGHTHTRGSLRALVGIANGNVVRANTTDVASTGYGEYWRTNNPSEALLQRFILGGTNTMSRVNIDGTSDGNNGTSVVAGTTNIPSHSHSGTASASFSNTAIDIRPKYLDVFYVIKVI